MEIRESQIEDILAGAPFLTRDILRLEEEPRLVCRQMLVPSGRLDLLYAYRTQLVLIELKTVPFQRQFVKQLTGYVEDLVDLQRGGNLLQGDISPYLLVTDATEPQVLNASMQNIGCVVYDPGKVLNYFYSSMKPIAFFTQTKPIDIGIWNIHLIHTLLYTIEEGIKSVTVLRKRIGGSARTLYNKIRFAHELRLIDWLPNADAISLTALGQRYCRFKDLVLPSRLSEGQADLIRSFVMTNPYESSVILGIASAVEAVFVLARNTYPVPFDHMIAYFTLHAGKYFDWQKQKAKYNATFMYSHYATDLGLLAKAHDSLYLTPEGIRFTVQMQLHKGLKLVESMRIT